MSPAAVALLAMLASAQEAAAGNTDNPRAAVAQEVVTRPPPRAVTEVAQPAPSATEVPERPAGDPATGAPADPAPADPQPGEPAPPAPVEPAATGAPPTVPVPAPATPIASSPPVASPLPSSTVTAGPGFSTEIDAPLDPINAAPAPVSEGGVRLSPTVWAVLLALLLAGGAAVLNQRHRRLIERTRGMLSLSPSLDTGAPRPPGKLAFARPSTSISSRLEPGATRWKE